MTSYSGGKIRGTSVIQTGQRSDSHPGHAINRTDFISTAFSSFFSLHSPIFSRIPSLLLSFSPRLSNFQRCLALKSRHKSTFSLSSKALRSPRHSRNQKRSREGIPSLILSSSLQHSLLDLTSRGITTHTISSPPLVILGLREPGIGPNGRHKTHHPRSTIRNEGLTIANKPPVPNV